MNRREKPDRSAKLDRREKRRRAWASLRGARNKRPAPRPFLGVRFDCCHVYARIYRSPDGTAYVGRCPRCLRPLRIRIGPHGLPARFFRAW